MARRFAAAALVALATSCSSGGGGAADSTDGASIDIDASPSDAADTGAKDGSAATDATSDDVSDAGALDDSDSTDADDADATDATSADASDAGGGWSDAAARIAVAASAGDALDTVAVGANAAGVVVTGSYASAILDDPNPATISGVFIAHFTPAGGRDWLRTYGASFGTGIATIPGAAETRADGVTALTYDRIETSHEVHLALVDAAGAETWNVTVGSGLDASAAAALLGVSLATNATDIVVLGENGAGATLTKYARADGTKRWGVSFDAADPHRPAPGGTTTYGRHWVALDDAGNVFVASASTPAANGRVAIHRYDGATGAFVDATDATTCGVDPHASNLFWIHYPGVSLSGGCPTGFATSGQGVYATGSSLASDYGTVTTSFGDVSQSPFPGSPGSGFSDPGALLQGGESTAAVALDGTVYALGEGMLFGKPDEYAIVVRKIAPDGTVAP